VTPEEFLRRMEENKDEKFRDFTVRILNTPLEVVGVRMPVLRKTAKEICRGDWRSFVSRSSDVYEFNIVKGLVIATAKMSPEERLSLTEGFVPEILDWSVCDTFCGTWKLEKGYEPELWDYCVSLLDSWKEFPMRVGAVMMMDKFIDDEHIDRMLALLTRDLPGTGYYWDMGCAWALSFCYVKYPDETEKQIFSGRLSDDVLRMTVYKIRDSFRVPDERKASLKRRYREFTGRSGGSLP